MVVVSRFKRLKSAGYLWHRNCDKSRAEEVAMINQHVELGETNGHGIPEAGLIPRSRTLEGFARETGDGIDVRSLETGTTLLVQTRHTQYRFVVLNGTRLLVLVKGGDLFRRGTQARLNGATSGGSALKAGWICQGSRVELSAGGRRVVTSPVQSITVESVQ
ncbi:MAG TPA: hypothetical protein VK864_02540 [Longimicrobiales bacterium]|nr:hypothetical protein [Longimicrobiales bacterium]